MMRASHRRLLLLSGVGLMLVLASLSCNMPSLDFTVDLTGTPATATSTTEVEVATATGTEPPVSPEPTATPTKMVARGPTMTPLAPPAIQSSPLSEEGPWLVYRARGELGIASDTSTFFIANADGSGRRPIRADPFPPLEVKPSPGGDRFAYILPATDSVDALPHLIIRRIPGGEVETDITLVSPEVFEALSGQAEVMDQILSAVAAPQSFSWSPHGHYLAFVGALDSTNADLYRFDTWSDHIRRLTDGPNHGFQLNWAPDGEWLLHLAVERFENGEAAQVEGVWVVAPDGSKVKRLYQTGGLRQVLVAWLDEAHFLATESSSTGYRNLIRGSVDGTASQVLYEGPFVHPSMADLDDLGSALAFILAAEDLSSGDAESEGVYILQLGETIPDLVLPGRWRSVEWWDGKGVFIANGEEGTAFIRRTGEVVKEMPEIPQRVSLSPDAMWMVAYGEDGVKVYTHIGVLIRNVTDAGVTRVVWEPDASGFFLEAYPSDNPASSHHLYRLDIDRWEMVWVDLNVAGGYFWAGPAVALP